MKKKKKDGIEVPTSHFYLRCHVIMFYNVLQVYICMCVFLRHTHIHTLTHACTYTGNCSSIMGRSVLPLFMVISIMFGTHFLDKTGEMAGKKNVGLTVFEILLLNCTLGRIIFFCSNSLKRANSLWSSWRDLLTDHTLIVMLGEYWKKRNPHFNIFFLFSPDN